MVVRHRLSRKLRSQFDSLDFAQDACASFFHISEEQFTFRTPQELVAFLTRIARHKVIDAYRQRQRTVKHSRHDVQAIRLRPLDPKDDATVHRDTASQLAIAEEQWELLLRDQPPEIRRALELLREGRSQQEVADCVGLPRKMIERLLKSLSRKLKLS